MANNNQDKMMMGAGLAVLAAGAYFFLGPDGKKHQKKMKGWMVKMKGEVLERLEEAKDVSQPVYDDIVDTVAKANAVAGKIPKSEILALASDLKRQWRSISRGSLPKKAAKRPARSTTQKPKTKTAKK
ncbi:MAG: hypothetical protein V4465_02000 [Patescibacteria group bacterium]